MKNENVHWALTSHRHVKTRLTHPYFRKWQHFSTRRSTALAAAGAAAGLVLQETMIAHYNKLLNRLITGFGMGCAELLHPEKVKRQKHVGESFWYFTAVFVTYLLRAVWLLPWHRSFLLCARHLAFLLLFAAFVVLFSILHGETKCMFNVSFRNQNTYLLSTKKSQPIRQGVTVGSSTHWPRLCRL